MALKGLLGDRQKIRQTLPATNKEQNEILALQIELEDCKQKAKGKKKADSPSPQDILSKQPVTTAGHSSKLAAPLPPNKTTTTAAQDIELTNAMSPTAVPATPSVPLKTLATLLQRLRQTAPTLTMITAIRTRSAALHAAHSVSTTEHATL